MPDLGGHCIRIYMAYRTYTVYIFIRFRRAKIVYPYSPTYVCNRCASIWKFTHQQLITGFWGCLHDKYHQLYHWSQQLSSEHHYGGCWRRPVWWVRPLLSIVLVQIQLLEILPASCLRCKVFSCLAKSSECFSMSNSRCAFGDNILGFCNAVSSTVGFFGLTHWGIAFLLKRYVAATPQAKSTSVYGMLTWHILSRRDNLHHQQRARARHADTRDAFICCATQPSLQM
jgi:hypothetical protein